MQFLICILKILLLRRNKWSLNKIHGVLNFLWDIDGWILGGDPVLAHLLYITCQYQELLYIDLCMRGVHSK